MSRLPRRFVLLLPPVALVLLAGCGGGHGADAAFARYLEADARPNDPSLHVEFGRAKLPSDFPPGLPVPHGATLLGWTRSTSDSGLAWEAIYTAAGDTGSVAAALESDLAAGDWQVRDRAQQHGFQSLDLAGAGANDGRTGVISVGPNGGGVQIIETATQDR